MPGPMFQMSVMGRWCQMVRLNSASSSHPMPSCACLALTSRATFARNRLGPMPAVAGMPVCSRTAPMSVTAKLRASVP